MLFLLFEKILKILIMQNNQAKIQVSHKSYLQKQSFFYLEKVAVDLNQEKEEKGEIFIKNPKLDSTLFLKFYN